MDSALPENRNRFASASIETSSAKPATHPNPALGSGVSRGSEINYLAHDARNWLTVLRVYCDMLRTPGAIACGYEKWMEELSIAVTRGQELILSLLDSVQPTIPANNTTDRRAGTGVQAIAASPSWNVGAAIARRLPLFERLAGNDIHVEIDAPESAGNLSLPENAFERILQNLVGNAIEAMPRGGRLRIALRPVNRRQAGIPDRRSEATLLLRVDDTGNGIAPEHLPYIFEAGVSGKPKCETGGVQHGFGLAIVRELAERAGGAVRVRSYPGRGSCFEVELPTV